MNLDELKAGVKYDNALGVMTFSHIEPSVFVRGWLRYPSKGYPPAAVFLDAFLNFGTYLLGEEVYGPALHPADEHDGRVG